MPITRSAPTTLVANYNLAATSYTYSFFRGPNTVNGSPLGYGVKSEHRVKTAAGAQTTVSTFTASAAPFAGLVAGDMLLFPNAPTVTPVTGPTATNTYPLGRGQERIITVATDDNNCDIHSAIDLSIDTTGYAFYWKKFKTGTGAEDGWFKTADFSGVQFNIQVTTLNATSIDYSIEGRNTGPNTAAQQLDVGSITSSALGSNAHSFYLGVPYDQCRVGLKVTGDAGTQAVWVNVIGEYFDGR